MALSSPGQGPSSKGPLQRRATAQGLRDIRYWVGGAGTWDNATTTNWSTSSGGPSGASVPTTKIDAVFDSNSGNANYIVTVALTAACHDLKVANPTGGTVTLNSGIQNLSISGSFYYSGGTLTLNQLNFSGLESGIGITTNGNTITCPLSSSAPGAYVTQRDNLTSTNTISTNPNATWDTAGFSITATALQASTGGTFNFNSSSITLSALTPINFGGSTILGVNTSTITCTGGTTTFNGNGLNFNNVIFSNIGNSVGVINGANTFNNLTLTPDTGFGRAMLFSANQTITGTFTATGNTPGKRLLITSSTHGTARTITAAAVSLTDVDFTDITGAGAAAPFTGTRLGNRTFFSTTLSSSGASNNSGITFTTGVTKFWVGGAGNWSDATNHWALTSGGAAGANNYPLPQDSITFDTASSGGSYTLTSDQNIFVINMTVGNPTVGTILFSSGGGILQLSGNLSLAAITAASTLAINFATNTSATITFNGYPATTGTWQFSGNGATWTLQDNNNNAGDGRSINLSQGTLDLNGKTISGDNFSDGIASLSHTLTSSSAGALIRSTTAATGLTFTGTGATLTNGTNISFQMDNGGGFAGGGRSWGSFISTPTITKTNNIDGGNTFNSFTYTSQAGLTSIFNYALQGDMTITNALTVSSASTVDKRSAFTSDIPGTARTITAGSVSLSDCDFQDITAAGVATPWTGTRLGDLKGNTNITFTTGVNKFWVGNSANWNAANVWALTTGGAGATNNFPLAQDTCIFDGNSFSANGQTVTGITSTNIGVMDWSSITKTGIVHSPAGGGSQIHYGNFTGNANLSVTGTTAIITFSGRGSPQTLTLSGTTWQPNITVDSPGGTLQLNDALTISGATTQNVTLTRGTLNMNAKAVSVGLFSSLGSNTRSITSGGATMTLTGNNSSIWNVAVTGFTLNDALQVNSNYTGSIGTRTIGGNLLSETNSPSITVNAGTDLITITSGCKNLDFTGFAGTWNNFANTIYGNLILSTTMTVGSGSSALTFSSTSGTKTITNNARTMDFPVTFNGIGGTWQLLDNMTVGSTRTTTLTNGTIDLNGKILTTGLINSNNSNVRTLKSSVNDGGKLITTDTVAGDDVMNLGTSTNFTIDRTNRDPNTVLLVANENGLNGQTLFRDQCYSNQVQVAGQTIYPKRIITNGAAQWDTSQAPTGARSSLTTTNNTDYISIDDHPDINFGSGDFTVEGFLRFSSVGGAQNDYLLTKQQVSSGIGAIRIFRNTTSLLLNLGSGGSTWDIVNASNIGTVAINTWYHFAVTRQGTTIRKFLNGTKDATDVTSSASLFADTTSMKIGGDPLGVSNALQHWTACVRIIKGTAKYTANFTVPNAPLGPWVIEIGGNTVNIRTIALPAASTAALPQTTITNTTAGGQISITGLGTVKALYVSTPPQSIKINTGSTVTIEDDYGFPSGTAGNLITLDTISGAGTFNLTKTGGPPGVISSDFLSISRSTATPSTTKSWFAGHNSTNVTTNTGWIFTGNGTIDPFLNGALSFAGVFGRLKSLVLTAALSFIGALTKFTTKALPVDTLSFVGSILRTRGVALASALSFVGDISRTISHSLTGTLSFIGTILKSTQHLLTGALSFIGSFTKRLSRSFTGTLSFIGSVILIRLKNLVGTLSFISSFSRSTIKVSTGTLTFVGAINKFIKHLMTAAANFIGTQQKNISKKSTSTLSFAGVFAKGLKSALASTLSFIGNITTSVLRKLTHTGTLSFIGSKFLSTGKASSGSVSFSGIVTKSPIKVLIGISSFIGAVAKFIPIPKFNSTLSFIGLSSLIKNKLLSGVLSFIGSTPVKAIAHKSTGTLNLVSSFVKTTIRALFGVSSFSTSMQKFINRPINATLNFVGTFVKTALHLLSLTATLSFISTFAKLPNKIFAGTLNLSAAIIKGMKQNYIGVLNFSGSMIKLPKHFMSAVLNFSGVFSRIAAHFINVTATLSFIGSFSKFAGKVTNGSLNFAGLVKRSTTKGLTSTVSFTGVISRVLRRFFTAISSFSGNFFGHKTSRFSQAFTGSLSFSGKFLKTIPRKFTATVSFIGAFGQPTIKGFGKVYKVILSTVSVKASIKKLNKKNVVK